MIQLNSLPPRRRGVAAVELALLLPIIMILLLGIWEVGRMIIIQQILSNAAREGGRQAATGLQTNAQVEQVVRTYVQNEGLPIANLTVSVKNLNAPGTEVKDAVQLDPLEVTVTIPVNDIRWSTIRLVTDATTKLTGQAVWRAVKDKDFPDVGDPAIE
jgi:Flp pilus assembly protein TadG